MEGAPYAPHPHAAVGLEGGGRRGVDSSSHGWPGLIKALGLALDFLFRLLSGQGTNGACTCCKQCTALNSCRVPCLPNDTAGQITRLRGCNAQLRTASVTSD